MYAHHKPKPVDALGTAEVRKNSPDRTRVFLPGGSNYKSISSRFCGLDSFCGGRESLPRAVLSFLRGHQQMLAYSCTSPISVSIPTVMGEGLLFCVNVIG